MKLYIGISGAPLFDEKDKVISGVLCVCDVTESKRKRIFQLFITKKEEIISCRT